MRVGLLHPPARRQPPICAIGEIPVSHHRKHHGATGSRVAQLRDTKRSRILKAEENAMGDRLQGKTALVTGAGMGIGRAIAVRFAAEGANVVVSDINDEAARSVATEIGETSIINHCDTSVEAEVAGAIDAAVKAFGTIDVLVNNAGVGGRVEWDRMIPITLSGVMYGCKHGCEARPGRGGGAIVNMSSMLG